MRTKIALALMPALAGCGVLDPPDSSIRLVNLSDLTVSHATVTPCDTDAARSVQTPILPGSYAEVSADPGCHDVQAEAEEGGEMFRAGVRITLEESARVDVRLRPVMFSVN